MAASHVALLASTGRSVIGVFHTLSAGKAGQFVPGRVVPRPLAADAVGIHPAPSRPSVASSDPKSRRRARPRPVVIRRGTLTLAQRTSDVTAVPGHNGAVHHRLQREFFARDPVRVARDLIGCVLVVARTGEELPRPRHGD